MLFGARIGAVGVVISQLVLSVGGATAVLLYGGIMQLYGGERGCVSGLGRRVCCAVRRQLIVLL